MRRSFRTLVCFFGRVPRVGTLGWYVMPIQGIESETWLGYAIGNVVGGPVSETWCAHGIGNVAVPFTLVGKLTYLRSRFVFGFFVAVGR